MQGLIGIVLFLNYEQFTFISGSFRIFFDGHYYFYNKSYAFVKENNQEVKIMFYVKVSVFYNPILLSDVLDCKFYEARFFVYLPDPGLNERVIGKV